MEGDAADELKCVYLTKKTKKKKKGSRAQCRAALGGVAMVTAYMPYTPLSHTHTHTHTHPNTTPCISVINYKAPYWPPDSESTRRSSLFKHLSYHIDSITGDTVNVCSSRSKQKAAAKKLGPKKRKIINTTTERC